MPRRTSVPKRRWARPSQPCPPAGFRTPPVVIAPALPDYGPCGWRGCGDPDVLHLRRDDGARPCGRRGCGCRHYTPEGQHR